MGSGLKPALAHTNLSFILPTSTMGRESNYMKSLEYTPTQMTSAVFLRKTKSEYRIDETRRKCLSAP